MADLLIGCMVVSTVLGAVFGKALKNRASAGAAAGLLFGPIGWPGSSCSKANDTLARCAEGERRRIQ